MRHRNSGRKLGRTSSHRKALMLNLCQALIQHELIKTTLPKAKELRKLIEPMITVAKRDTVAARRYAFDKLRSRDAVTKLFSQLGPRFEPRAGGYTRIIKCGFRVGDQAPMAVIELVDRQPQTQEKVKPAAKPKASDIVEAVEDAEVVEVETQAVEKPKKPASRKKSI